MRLLIGTLYSGENEFDECVAALGRQSHRDFEHLVIEGLPKREAHHRLYGTFMERAGEFGALVKVDADMVVEDPELFSGIIAYLGANPHIDDLEIAVHDFFVDRLVFGMHAYRNNVCWELSEDGLFTDYPSPVPRERHHLDREELAPAAVHCKNPSPFQAFHFGLHRGCKAVQRGRPVEEKIFGMMVRRWREMRRVEEHFHRSRNPLVGLAVAGAEAVYAGLLGEENLTYGDVRARVVFERYAGLGYGALRAAIRRLRARSFGFLPGRFRLGVLRRRWGFR